MCPNVLTAIRSIVEFKNNDLKDYSATYHNRINQVGQQLEYYVKDAICDLFKSVKNQDELAYSRGVFSYSGTQNNPPDIIIANGDAFEIKKIENLKSTLALNNSPPKDQLHSDDPRITKECRKADGGNWKSKEMFYVVGCAPKKQKGMLKYLFFVHGRCYAAERETYERLASRLKSNIKPIIESESQEITKTIELGRINRMDPLRITNFRIRGMWEIENPIRVFSYLHGVDERKSFSLAALMTKEKYDSFPKDIRDSIENDKRIISKIVQVKNPNNPAQLLEAQLVTSWW